MHLRCAVGPLTFIKRAGDDIRPLQPQNHRAGVPPQLDLKAPGRIRWVRGGNGVIARAVAR